MQNTFKRDIWTYDQGDYEFLSGFGWNSIYNDDFYIYAKTFSDKILEMTKEWFSNRTVTVRPHELPWMNGSIRKLMRKRNRLCKNIKQTKLENVLRLIERLGMKSQNSYANQNRTILTRWQTN